MGMFADAFKAVGKAAKDGVKEGLKRADEAAQRSCATRYIADLVRQQFADLMKEMPEMDNFSERIDAELQCADGLEVQLLKQAGFLMEQAKLDGHYIITSRDVHQIIVETVRKIKIEVCEFDGKVSLGDQGAIQRIANGLQTKVKSRFLAAQMANKPNTIVEWAVLFSDVEQAVIKDAIRGVSTEEEKMRVRQAVLFAVSGLRVQRLAA